MISEKETIVRLAFGDSEVYKQAMEHLGRGSNDFYRLLAQGTLKAAEHYGGKEFACVLGQEMAGYATGEVYFASQALGLRHSHLDSAGYSYDQKEKSKEAYLETPDARSDPEAKSKDVSKAVDFLVKDEQGRAFLTSMVACLFARTRMRTNSWQPASSRWATCPSPTISPTLPAPFSSCGGRTVSLRVISPRR